MKDKYMLFGWDKYYTTGGEHDVLGSFPSLEAAEDRARSSIMDYTQILDLDTGKWGRIEDHTGGV